MSYYGGLKLRWIKHQTDSIDSPFIQDLLTEFGPQGYLAYYGILEIVAKAVGYNPLQKVNFSSTFLKQKLHISSGKLREIFGFCSGKGELIFNFSKENFEFEIPKLAILKDNYSKDLQATGKKLAHHIEEEVDKEVDKEKNKPLSPSQEKAPEPVPVSILPKHRVKVPKKEWPPGEAAWLQKFLKEQTLYPVELLFDYPWWEAISHKIAGFDIAFLEKEWATMVGWIIQNPKRAPLQTEKGIKTFVGGWLERSKEKERRYKNGN